MNRTVRKLRVGVLTKPLDNWNSGSGHHLDELMKALLDLNQNEGCPLDLTFIHYGKSDNPIYSRVRELIIPRNPISASARIRKEGFDIVHYSPLTVYAPLWGIKAKKFATVHGIEEALYPQGYTFLQRFHANQILPVLMRMMDGIATVSNTSAGYFKKHFRIPGDRLFITTNGFSPNFRIIPKEEAVLPNFVESALGGKPFILHISRYSMRKNPEGIIRGFADFRRKTGLDWKLVCAGKGWDGNEAKAIVRQAGLEGQYIAPGFIQEIEAVALLNRAESFLFPSFAEGFGMPNVEAMACGCPVVTSGIFAIPEIVGDAALVVQDPRDHGAIGDALKKIATGDGIKKALVERGLKRCGLYNWNDSAKSLFKAWVSPYETL